MKAQKILTAGYSGHDATSFIAKLEQHGVAVVVDVRRNPISRKKGFSRTRLAQILADANLEYVHLRELGVPNALRTRLKVGEIDLSEYLVEFEQYLETQGAALDKLYSLANSGNCCLLCVEQLPEECHRSVVATAVAARNGRTLEIIHI